MDVFVIRVFISGINNPERVRTSYISKVNRKKDGQSWRDCEDSTDLKSIRKWKTKAGAEKVASTLGDFMDTREFKVVTLEDCKKEITSRRDRGAVKITQKIEELPVKIKTAILNQKAFRIDREILAAGGFQSYGVFASNKEEAYDKFCEGEDIYLGEECEVVSLDEIKLDGIYEIEPEDCVENIDDNSIWPTEMKELCEYIESTMKVNLVYSLEFMLTEILPNILKKNSRYGTYQIYNDCGLHGFSFVVDSNFEKVEVHRGVDKDLLKAVVKSVCLCLESLEKGDGF